MNEFNTQQLRSIFASDEAALWTIPEFLASYTLHDSQLMEWRFSRVPCRSMFLIVNWDLVWNSAAAPSFDCLMIHIPVCYRVAWTEGSFDFNTIEGAESNLLSVDERTRLLEDGCNDLRAYRHDDAEQGSLKHPAMDDTLTKTTITGINWSKLEVLHAASVQILACDGSGNLFSIPKPLSAR